MNYKKISIGLKARARVAEHLEKKFKGVPDELATAFWTTVWELKNYPNNFGDDYEKFRAHALYAFISALDLSQYLIESAKKDHEENPDGYWKEYYEEQREIALEVLNLVCKMAQCL